MDAGGHPTEVAGGDGEILPEEMMRANTYALLAVLLREPPSDVTLEELAALQPDNGEIGRALAALAAVAGELSTNDIDDEFHDLFVGVGASELKPYGSYYLTGFMYEKPLAKLRAEMAALGLGKADETPEPEDHIASLCEMMCAMITGAFTAPVALDRQREFFNTHVAPWAERFFEDMEGSPSARFYRPVGTVGRLFLRIEAQSFEMAA